MCLTSLVCFSFVLEGVLVRVYSTYWSRVCAVGAHNKHLVATPCELWDVISNIKRQPRATLRGNFGKLWQVFLQEPSKPSFLPAEVKRPRNGGTEGYCNGLRNANGGMYPDEHGVTVVRKAKP